MYGFISLVDRVKLKESDGRGICGNYVFSSTGVEGIFVLNDRPYFLALLVLYISKIYDM